MTEQESCIACDKPILRGDLVYRDASGGFIHATCCGPEPESYVDANDEPLKPGDPIPKPFMWTEGDWRQ